jgi:adenylylsulfate kinase
VWVTGLPASGKSTLARRLAARLRSDATPCAVLDGDDVRSALGRPAGRGERERDAFYAALAALASLLAAQGLVVVVAATAGRRTYRERARDLAPRYLEVHVATPAAECERRDPKGLYTAARAGRATGVPGLDAPYDVPASPEVVAAGGDDAGAVERLAALLREPIARDRDLAVPAS